MFLSIFAATCRPENITRFLDNLAATAADLSSFEVLLKVDDDDNATIAAIQNYIKTSPLTIKYLATPKLDGYYTLNVGYNELLKIVHPDSYFCWLLTDEIIMETRGWDNILKKYIGFFKDDIFRIKLSIFQLKNYNEVFECMPMPDNYAVTTRKWLELTGGWGNFWGPDSWHQCVDYFLGLRKNEFYPYGVWRSLPVFDIKIGGQEAGEGITDPHAILRRHQMIWHGWNLHTTYEAQENFSRLAARLDAHIYAKAKNIATYVLTENLKEKTLSLLDSNGQVLQKLDYKIPKWNVTIKLGYKIESIARFFPKINIALCGFSFSLIHNKRVRKIQDFMSRYRIFIPVRFVLRKLYAFMWYMRKKFRTV